MVNARIRALQHIEANTGGIIKTLSKDSSTKLLLFNIRRYLFIHSFFNVP
jgi:hypothetical protein